MTSRKEPTAVAERVVARVTKVAALSKTLQHMLLYIGGPDGDGHVWTITMTDEAFLKTRQLEKLGLVKFEPRTNRKGAPQGADAVATEKGKSLIKKLRATGQVR